MRARYCGLIAAGCASASIWPTWPPLLRVWADTADYRHGPLVVLISLAWLIAASAQIHPPRAGRIRWPASLLALFLFVWLIAYKANIEIGKEALAPLIIGLAIATAVGWRAAAALSAPILYFYFAIPIWDLLVPSLQWMTVVASHAALGLMGIPARIEGVLVTIPEGSFIVQEGCSGEKFLVVALAAAGLIAAVTSMPRRRTIVYLVLTAALALIANWLRVIIVIYAGHATNMTSYLVTREHISLGWAIFIVLLGVVWSVGGRIHGTLSDGPVRTMADGASASQVRTAGLITAGALLCVPVLAMVGAAYTSAEPGTTVSLAIPHAGIGWRPVQPSAQWSPRFIGASEQFRVAFEANGGLRVESFGARYATQVHDAKLIHYSNRVNGDKWLTLSVSSSTRALHGGGSRVVRTILAQTPDGSRWLIDFYYAVDGIIVTRDWEAQLLYGLLSWERPAPSGINAAAAECAPSCEAAARRLADYWTGTGFNIEVAHGGIPVMSTNYTNDLPRSR